MSFLEALDRELAAVGLRGRRRRRILAEFADHLACDSRAELGEPTQLAHQFADELGTGLARRAARASFTGLAAAALLLAVGLLAADRARFFSDAASSTPPIGYIAMAMVVLGGQVAFVAGMLALLRVWRHRHASVFPREEAVVIVRRAALGLGAGLVTMAGFALSAVALANHADTWWTTLALSVSGAAAIALLAASPSVVAAARLRPVAGGSAGDLYEDFGPLVPRQLQGRPWRFAIAVAAAVALAIAAAGIAQSDPFDGVLRGLLDGAACLIGFGALGRYLGLRRLG